MTRGVASAAGGRNDAKGLFETGPLPPRDSALRGSGRSIIIAPLPRVVERGGTGQQSAAALTAGGGRKDPQPK